MRLGVISDTHGDRWAIEECIQLAGHVDAWLHLGDNVRDTKTLEATDVPVYGVRGNTDFGTKPDGAIVELGGKRLFLCHGHTYGVEAGLDPAMTFIGAMDSCHAALFGHTHVASR